MARIGEFVGCPQCAAELYVIKQGAGEFELECVQGHQLRRFFVLIPPDPPPPPERSEHAAQNIRPPR